jgi:hypothetical protein
VADLVWGQPKPVVVEKPLVDDAASSPTMKF